MNESSVFSGMQRPLPNSTAVLVLGILSILGCCGYGIPGVIFSIIALYLAAKDNRLYKLTPEAYTSGSYTNLKAGKICAIIGLIICLLFMVFVLIIIGMVGIAALNDPEAMREALQRYQ